MSNEVNYLPAPPPLKDETPGDPPEPGNVFIPGSWGWNTPSNSYLWEPGSWSAPQPGWSWVAPSYNWTPGGYIPSGGYWDYAPARRGTAFAPVFVSPALRTRPGYSYLPTQIVPPEVIGNFLTGPGVGPRSTYNNARFVDFKTAPRIKRVAVPPALRAAEAKFARELREVGHLRHVLEKKLAGPRRSPYRGRLALPKPRPHRKVTTPRHPLHHRYADRPRPKTDARHEGKKSPSSRITRKAPPKHTGGKVAPKSKPGVKKPGARKTPGAKKKPAAKSKPGAKKKGGAGKKGGKGKKSGAAKKGGGKKKGGAAKKGGKKK